MAESVHIEIDVEKLIKRNFVALKKYLHPDPVLDCETSFQLFSITDRKDIKGKDPSEKNYMILRKVISKGAKGYADFKERLQKTFQTELLELLTCAENGQDTKEILKDRLEKMSLDPDYIKYKCKLSFS